MTSATGSKQPSKTQLSLRITAETPSGQVELIGLFSNDLELRRLLELFRSEVVGRLVSTSDGLRSLTYKPSFGYLTPEECVGSDSFPGKISFQKI